MKCNIIYIAVWQLRDHTQEVKKDRETETRVLIIVRLIVSCGMTQWGQMKHFHIVICSTFGATLNKPRFVKHCQTINNLWTQQDRLAVISSGTQQLTIYVQAPTWDIKKSLVWLWWESIKDLLEFSWRSDFAPENVLNDADYATDNRYWREWWWPTVSDDEEDEGPVA